MNKDNGFDYIINFVFAMSPQLGGIGHKSQDLVTHFRLGEGETTSQFHLRYLHIRSDIFLLQYETVQINNIKGKYIMELSKFKHIQCYTTTFELDHRKIEYTPKIHQLSTIFQYTIGEVFETLETADLDM